MNLVPNGDFEGFSVCPNTGGNFNGYVDFWFNPTQGTPEYFNACCSTSCFGANVPNAGPGFQNAQSGNAYAGLFAFQQIDQREYIEVQLINTLISSHRYYCEMYVSLADIMRYATSRIGFCFSQTQLSQSDLNLFNQTPQVENTIGNYLTSQANWMKITGSFIASGGEQWMTIGNFYNDANTDTLLVLNTIQKFAYYYIDDVSVIDSTAIGIAEQEKNNAKLHVFPNPAMDEINIEFSELKKGILFVTDVNGKIVLEKNFEQQILQLDVSNLEAGVYFVEAVLDNGKSLRQKVMKE